jgi:hypothetical protein
MFDINNIVNAAITQALNAAVHEAIATLVVRVDTLEGICATQHEGMVAMRDRITALENQAIVTSNAVDARIAALENNPAQGQDLTPTTGLTRDQVEALIERTMDHHLECYDHDNYDEIASKVDDLPDLDDYVTRDEVRSEIEDVLNNATLSLSI